MSTTESPAKKRRASGSTQSQEVTKDESDNLAEPVETAVLPDERERRFRTPGFHRMRIEWRPDEIIVMHQVENAIEERVIKEWADAYHVMSEVYDTVRTPELDDDGNPKKDRYGFVIWARTPGGGYDEDFNRLTHNKKEHFLFLTTTRMFEWEQRSARAWLESMMAKAQWEERFAIAYDDSSGKTIDDRRAAGNKDAADERYFAIFQAGYSRRCEALVRSLNLLGQRLRDSLMT